MALSLNLRSDLAKLTDAELAHRLEQSFRAYDAANDRKRWWNSGSLSWIFRGPIRHPRAYRFFAALTGSSGSWLDVLFATVLSDKRSARLLGPGADVQSDLYLQVCEMRDIVDEAERRIAHRQGQTS